MSAGPTSPPPSGHEPDSPAPDAPLLTIVLNGAVVSDPVAGFPMVAQMFEVFVMFAAGQGGRLPDLTLVVTDDLHSAIAEVTDEPGFTGERLGGVVAGKTVKADPEWSAATVLVPAAHWPDGQATPLGILLLAHEFTHALLGGLRHRDGWARTEDDNDATYAARLIAVECVDEIRADCFSDMVLGMLSKTTTADGEVRPTTTRDLLGSRSESVLELVDSHVYPAWPDLVTGYKDHKVDLGTLWSTLCGQTEQAFVTMAHTDAEHVLDSTLPTAIASAADHPGMVHYLAPTWQAMTAPIHAEATVPTADEIVQSDIAVGAAGQASILAMWAKLGVTPSTLDDGGLYLHVEDPEPVEPAQ